MSDFQDQLVSILFCSEWQWWLDFGSENPNRRTVHIGHEDKNGIQTVLFYSGDNLLGRFYPSITYASKQRLMALCEKHSWKWGFASDDRYVFNRRLT